MTSQTNLVNKGAIGFIGCGKMASALIDTMIKQGKALPGRIIGSDKHVANLKRMQRIWKIRTTTDNAEVVKQASIVFLTVKPQNMKELFQELGSKVKGKLIVSIAAGIRMKSMETKFQGARIIRIMPNTPCLVGEMAAAMARGKDATAKDAASVRALLVGNGLLIEVREGQLDAVTALSGSGPAYFSTFICFLASAGTKKGLSSEDAHRLAIQTCLGTGKLLRDQRLSPDDLIDMVKSKRGTTEAALKALDRKGFRKAIDTMVDAAYRRSKELGKDD